MFFHEIKSHQLSLSLKYIYVSSDTHRPVHSPAVLVGGPGPRWWLSPGESWWSGSVTDPRTWAPVCHGSGSRWISKSSPDIRISTLKTSTWVIIIKKFNKLSVDFEEEIYWVAMKLQNVLSDPTLCYCKTSFVLILTQSTRQMEITGCLQMSSMQVQIPF